MTARREAELLEAASAYIACAWPVFMLPSSKVPPANCARCKAEHRTAEAMEACRCLTCHGFYSATTDPGRARRMIARYPRGLLAVRTGAPSGLVVVDVDAGPRGGIATMRRLVAAAELPRTIVQRTGGGGYHLLYAHPGGRIQGGADKGGPGVDIKADGGYFIAAPSVHARTGRAYHWLSPLTDPLTPLPQAWADRLREQPRVTTASAWTPRPVRSASRYAAAALADEAAQVAATAAGGRNDALNTGAFRMARFAADGALTEAEIARMLLEASRSSGLLGDDGEPACLRTIQSGLRAGLAQQKAAG